MEKMPPAASHASLRTWAGRILRFCAGAFLGLAIIVLVMFNGLLLWVATGPRSLETLTPFIENAVSGGEAGYSVSIGETLLIWDGWEHPIDIRLRNVSVLTKSRQRFSRFPEVSIGLDVLELAQGRIMPSSLTITHPVISLYQREDRSISFGFKPVEDPDVPGSGELPDDLKSAEIPEQPAEPVPLAALIAHLVQPDASSPLRKLRAVTILDADIGVGNFEKGVFFKGEDANLLFKKSRRGVQMHGSAKARYEGHETLLDANLFMPHGSGNIDGQFTFSDILPGALADLFVHRNEVSGLAIPLSGQGTLSLEASTGDLTALSITVDGGSGTITHEKLAAPLSVRNMHLQASMQEKGAAITVPNLRLELEEDILVTASATASRAAEGWSLSGNAAATNIASDSLSRLWPAPLAPLTREWVVENIRGGTFSKAEVAFDLTPADIANKVMRREAIDAHVRLENASIKYLPEHPPVEKLTANIDIDALTLTAHIEAANYLKESKLSSGTVTIPDLNEDNPYITLDFTATSTTKEVIHFLSFPRLGHTQRLGLSEDAASGTVTGTAKLGFHFFTPEGVEDDIAYDISADVKDVAQPNFLKKFDITSATGNIKVDAKGVFFKGSGEVNGAKATEANVTYLFKPEDGYDTFIETTATTPVESLPRFGYPKFDFIKGPLGVKASVKVGSTKELATATVDLAQAAIDFTPVRYKKPAGESATLEFTTEKTPSGTSIPQFTIRGKELDGKGDASVTGGELSRVTFASLKYGASDVESLTYAPLPGGFKLHARGKAGDLSAWFDAPPGTESTFSFKNFPAIDVDVKLGTLILGKDRSLNNVRGTMVCDSLRCSGASFDGATTDAKPFQFRLMKNPKGKRQISLHAESAGLFLKTVGVFDSMEGGDLSITGTYTDTPTGSTLKGRMDTTAYTVKNAPVLAKMLTLASLTGFFDTLSGKGIAFAKLRAPFTLSGDTLTFTEAKTFGDAMGMTAEGTITFPKQTMNLKGTIVPSYSVNSVLGNVPIIGAVLTGGEGKGVFAASYTITGTGSAPDVSVNPLSILTPGFLRGLFDIFDAPAKKSDDEE